MTALAHELLPLAVDTAAPVRSPIAGATDAHVHIFDDVTRYPLDQARHYNPPRATVADQQAFARTIGTSRVVLVQPSVYGTDNRCMLDALDNIGPVTARGIAVIDSDETEADMGARLREMAPHGVCGVRINAITSNTSPDSLVRIARVLEPMGGHIQLWIEIPQLLQLAPVIAALTVPVVLDHMAQLPLAAGTGSEEFATVVRLLESGRCWIKLIGYRISKQYPTYGDLDPIARALIQRAPNRCLWGSDWPHVYMQGRPCPDAGRLLDQLETWGSRSEVERILTANPADLYGFSN